MDILVDRLTTVDADGGRKVYQEIAGTSSDSKPTGLASGSIFTEVNTGKVFFYNAAAGTWVEQFSFQS